MFNLLPYIFIVFPSFIGMLFYSKISKKEYKFNFTRFFIFLLLSNIIILIVLFYLDGTNLNIYDHICTFSHFGARYGLLLILINLFIGFMEFIKDNYFDISIEVKHEKKNNKNN